MEFSYMTVYLILGNCPLPFKDKNIHSPLAHHLDTQNTLQTLNLLQLFLPLSASLLTFSPSVFFMLFYPVTLHTLFLDLFIQGLVHSYLKIKNSNNYKSLFKTLILPVSKCSSPWLSSKPCLVFTVFIHHSQSRHDSEKTEWWGMLYVKSLLV